MSEKLREPKNKFKKLTMEPCGFCTRQIIVQHEKNGKLFIKDGKSMCMVCRAVKLSSHRKEIESSKGRMVKDLKGVNERFEKEETDRVIHLAAQAQAEVEKKSKS